MQRNRHSQTNCFSSRCICKNCLGFTGRWWRDPDGSGRRDSSRTWEGERAWWVTPWRRNPLFLANQEHWEGGIGAVSLVLPHRTGRWIDISQNPATYFSRGIAKMAMLHYPPSGIQGRRENKHFWENLHYFSLRPCDFSLDPLPIYI